MPTSEGGFAFVGQFGRALRVISSGQDSTVFRALDNSNGELAIKIAAKTNTRSAERVLHEFEHLRECQGCPYVVRVFSRVHSEQYIGFTQELCTRGDLFEVLRHYNPSMRSIAIAMAQIGSALQFIHHVANIIHGDLKPENIGVTSNGKLRIIDFGCAVKAKSGGVVSTCGTVEYASPEKLRRIPHGFEVDWWAYGVILFELVFGYLPFQGETSCDIAAEICTKDIHNILNSSSFQITESATSLIQSLLCKDMTIRLGCTSGFNEIKNSHFFDLVNVSQEIQEGIF